ncbi:MAG: FAD-binding oxidoreductase [Mycobacteriales bacterium]
MTKLNAGMLRKIGAIVGDGNVLSTPETTRGFSVDWTGRYVGQAEAVLRPRSTDEVAQLLALLSAEEIAVVPQGGNTGQVGGGVPLHGEVVLSLAGLDNLGPVDAESAQVTAGAGVTLATLLEQPRRHGLSFGVDIASRDSATIGGAIVTNAGGLRMIRYGDTAAQLLVGGGRACRRLRHLAPGRTRQGQHRLPAASAPGRLGGNPRGDHQGPAEAGAVFRASG